MRIEIAFFAAALLLANPWGLPAQTPCYQDQVLFPYRLQGLTVATNGTIYYADSSRGTVGILDIDYGRLIPLILGLHNVSAVEAAGNKVYFTESGTDAGQYHDGSLSVFDIESGTWMLIATGLHYPVSVFVDPTGTTYVLENAGSSTSYGGYDRLVKFAPGSSQASVVIPFVPSPGAVALDSRGQVIIGSWGYSIPGGAGSLLSYPPGSTNPVTLASGLPAITDLIIDRNDNLYFAGYGSDGVTIGIGEMPNGSTNVIPLKTGLLARCLALDAQGGIYYSTAYYSTAAISRLTPCHGPLIVTLTNPPSEATFLLPTSIMAAASVSGNTDNVTNVAFFDGTRQLGQAVEPPFGIDWTNPSPGPHVLVAVAGDSAGNWATSPPVNILVISNSGPIVHYVDLTCASPVPPYTSWATAATTIQDAVDAAMVGDEIVVTNGIYASFGARGARVAVTSPLSLRSVNGPRFTVIQGGLYLRCVTLASGASLSGFTLTNGSTAFGAAWASDEYRGGGVFCFDTTTVVSNCVLAGNSAGWEGGGAYGGTLINCTLTNNTAEYGGGAAGHVHARFGSSLGGIPGCRLINCTLTGNSAYFDGGGAYGDRFASGAYGCTLLNCTLNNNSSFTLTGGARNCSLTNCSLTTTSRGPGAQNCALNRCRLIANYEGGAQTCTLNNCTLTDHSPAAAAAQYCTLNNCTLTGNSVGAAGGTLNNCIVYDNHYQDYNGSSLNFCCTRFMPTNGIGNITNAPLFINEAGGNLRLAPGSPCIDAGNNTYVTTRTELDGRPRIIGAAVDMGAYEVEDPFNKWLEYFSLATDGSADFTDADGDGLNNWQEWIAGTVPTDSSSALRLLTPTPGAPGLILTWQSVSNRTYFLERATNFAGAPRFSLLSSNLAGQTGTTSFIDTNAIGSGPFFYRVGVQQ